MMGTGPQQAEGPPAAIDEVAAAGAKVLAAVGFAVVGQREPLRLALGAILAGGHVLIEDVPGLGKTLAARSLAAALGLDFRRVQCTPDLLPADVTGSYIFEQDRREFVFHPGPIFTGLLLVDEINRTPPKTQSAFLEAMQERQVTVEGHTRHLDRPFHVLATANPIEYDGTYPLPEAQLDRFLLRLDFGYPDSEEEAAVLQRRIERRREEATVPTVIDAGTLLSLQAGVEAVDVSAEITRYCVDVVTATRQHRSVEVGASPRGSLALLLVARALAVLAGRDYVLPEDVKDCAVAALGHRLTLRPETWASGVTGQAVVAELLDTVPAPAAAPPAGGGG
jgi:MoxR-like ATPase